MKQDSAAWKFRTQKYDDNIYSDLRTNSEYFLESILYILYVVSKLGKSGIQRFKSVQIKAEMKKLWPFEYNRAKLKDHFKIILKFNL